MFDGIGADMLGDPAGFTRRYTRLANCVQERGLSMIDVSHKRDDGPAWLEFLLLFNNRQRRRDYRLFHLVNAGPFFAALFFQNEPVILRDLRRNIGLDGLVDVSKDVVRHQFRDELMRF